MSTLNDNATALANHTRLDIRLEAVTSQRDVVPLAEITDMAILHAKDTLHEWMIRYTPHSEYDGTVEALTQSLEDPTYRIVKAVLTLSSSDQPSSGSTPKSSPRSATATPIAAERAEGGKRAGEEIIVGFVHWMCGYINVEKVDPFEIDVRKKLPSSSTSASAAAAAAAVVTVAVQQEVRSNDHDPADPTSNFSNDICNEIQRLESTTTSYGTKAGRSGAEERRREKEVGSGKGDRDRNTTGLEDEETVKERMEKAERLKLGDAVYVVSRNHYINAIRGRKHMYIRRLMVHPAYQRRGIASQLLKVVTDEADEKNVDCWLFARPSGYPLYRKVGFLDKGTSSMNMPGFECPEVVAMMRPRKSVR